MQFVGIDIDNEDIKLSIINQKKDFLESKSFSLDEFNVSSNVKQFYNNSAEKNFISSGLDLQDVLIKSAPFNVKNSFFTKKAISFQKDLITTIDPAQTIACYLKQKSNLKFFITTRSMLEKHLQMLSQIKIDPDNVFCAATALCSFAKEYFPNSKNSFILHVCKTKTYCILMKDFLPEKTFILKIGLSQFIDAMLEDKKNKNSSLDVSKLNHSSNLFKIIDGFKESIEKTFNSFTAEEEKYPLIATGEVDFFANFTSFIKNSKVSEILEIDKKEKNSQIKKYAISIGLALCAKSDEYSKIQFRNQDFIPEKKLLVFGKKIASFLCILFLSSALIFFAFSYYLSKNSSNLKQKLLELQKFENDHLGSNLTFADNNLFKNIDDFEDKIKKQTKNFPYFLQVPNVSQTLSWLNNNEILKNSQIITFNYSLESYPSALSKTDPYIAKIDLEFKTKTPADARAFYDNLLKGSGLVDRTQEIRWEQKNDSYTVSFYLKKTIHND
ncbi:MAG: hypothetical protein WCT85_02620 [Parachlamydiales bacterium]|jgi:hypothetical protein